MAARYDIMDITETEYDNIFGNSDPEIEGDVGEESDLDFDGLENENSESESDSESEQEDEVMLKWTNDLSHITVDDFASPTGITFELGNDTRQIDFFDKLFGEDTVAHIVIVTNRYARQQLAERVEQLAKWTDVTVPELRAYFGVCIIMGINSLPSIADYLSSDPHLGNEGIKKVMTKNHFEEITRFLHFNDSSTEPPRGNELHDRLYKVRPILNTFNQKMLTLYKPKKNISVDEGMIAFKGRLSFRQYMPAKPTKYGIKVWLAADASNGFVLNHKVYLGKEKKGRCGSPKWTWLRCSH